MAPTSIARRFGKPLGAADVDRKSENEPEVFRIAMLLRQGSNKELIIDNPGKQRPRISSMTGEAAKKTDEYAPPVSAWGARPEKATRMENLVYAISNGRTSQDGHPTHRGCRNRVR
jgi:hypothetical protein